MQPADKRDSGSGKGSESESESDINYALFLSISRQSQVTGWPVPLFRGVNIRETRQIQYMSTLDRQRHRHPSLTCLIEKDTSR